MTATTLTVPERFTITINMTSDWHVGEGLGRGEVDSIVQRDDEGLPYIPGKTLTGILRDGCEQVALALDNRGEKEKWQKWVEFIFGDQPALAPEAVEADPRPAVVGIGSAYLEETLRKALIAKPKLKNAIAFIKPGVAIDPETGSAMSDFLRFEEVVRMDAVLRSERCSLDFSLYPNITDEQKETAFALLVAGAKIVERLGGKRRRGHGNCTITIDDKGEDYLRWLQENYSKINEPPEWKNPVISNNDQHLIDAEANHSKWYAVPLTIKTLAPVVIPKRTVGNVVECLDYIPARYFLGYLHEKFGQCLNVSQAIALNHLIVTNSTLSIEGVPSRPTPFCLFTEKLNGDIKKGRRVYNRLKEPEPEGVQLKGERGGYLAEFNGSHFPEYKTIKLQVNTHNTIYDPVQRPTSDVGGVYSYQAIPAGTVFQAELRLTEGIKDHLDKKLPSWWQELTGNLRIGQSKKDQYGLIEIQAESPIEYPNHFQNMGKIEALYVWFLSDVLLRNERLNPTTDPHDFRRELERELEGQSKVKLVCPDLPNPEEEEQQASEEQELLSLMMRSRRTGAWHVRWGLPRPTLVGWQAGSCVVYKVTEGEVDPAKLAELEARGIGDRRAKGYGQVCFNDPLLMEKLSQLQGKESNKKSGDPPNDTFPGIPRNHQAFEYARIIEMAAWREAIENKALAIAHKKEKRQSILGIVITKDNNQPKSQPSMSQLGGVRSNLRKLRSEDDIEAISKWIETLKDKREKQWENTDQGFKKISDLVTKTATVWTHLELDLRSLVITENGLEQLKKDLWAEAVRTLVYAIIRAHKRALEDEMQKIDEQSQTNGVA